MFPVLRVTETTILYLEKSVLPRQKKVTRQVKRRGDNLFLFKWNCSHEIHRRRCTSLYPCPRGTYKTTSHRFAHPPCSSDLAPCEFCLFPRMKALVPGRRYHSAEVVITAIREAVRELPVMFQRCFQQLYQR